MQEQDRGATSSSLMVRGRPGKSYGTAQSRQRLSS
jgi:hypothetical protein